VIVRDVSVIAIAIVDMRNIFQDIVLSRIVRGLDRVLGRLKTDKYNKGGIKVNTAFRNKVWKETGATCYYDRHKRSWCARVYLNEKDHKLLYFTNTKKASVLISEIKKLQEV